VGVLVEQRVDVLGGQTQGGHAGGHGDGVTRQGARLVDGAGGGEVLHDVGAATEGGGRQATGDDLAEGGQVTGHPVDAVPAGVGGAETGHDLVHDEQRAVGVGDLLECGVEALTRGDGAHVAGRRLGDDRGDLTRVIGEGL